MSENSLFQNSLAAEAKEGEGEKAGALAELEERVDLWS